MLKYMNDKKDKPDVKSRIEAAAAGMYIGHQMGQWSERRWWGIGFGFDSDIPPENLSESLLKEDLCNPVCLDKLIQSPPLIKAPGYTPTCFVDTVPHICALGMEYVKAEGALSPEAFRDFILRERTWLRPQAVGRTCIELMAEGMDPRIAGLFAPSVISGCWIAWPTAFYNAGCPNDAYGDAVVLARSQNGGDIVILTGFLASILAASLVPGSKWTDVRDTALKIVHKRNRHVYSLLKQAIRFADRSSSGSEWLELMTDKEYRKKTSKYGIDWMADFYSAVSALEYSYLNNSDWCEFIRNILLSCDTRFGAMIALSIRAALDGKDTMPLAWLEKADLSNNVRISEWIEGSYGLLQKRYEKECCSADAILSQTDSRADKSVLYDRILAAMLAGAIGNVMGSPVEDRDYPWIVEKYGVLDRILDPKRLETEDDSAMAVMWAETYIRCGGRIYPEDLADTFREKMNPNKFYYDSQHAYDLMKKGLPPHACGHWNVVTGSALMGCYPCGMYHAGNPVQAAAEGRELAYHYQRGFDVHAAAILCAAVAEALRRDATVDSVLEAAVNAAPVEPQTYFNCLEKRDARIHLKNALAAVEGCTDVLNARKILYENYLEYNGQDPWEVVTFTLAMFKVAKGDVWQSMIGGTNIGRDSDTISSQAAILSACMHGMKGIPEHLLSLFGSNAMENYQALARDLTFLVRKRCVRSLDTARILGLF